jgi:predicted ATPase
MTDLEASTEHLRTLGDEFGKVLVVHHEIIQNSIADEGGEVVGSEGDSFAAIFPDASAALRAALSAQTTLGRTSWPDSPWRVRMAVHEGVVAVGGAGATGLALHEAARVRNVAHGGQIVVTDDARRGLCLPPGAGLIDLGTHAVRDFPTVVRLHQVTAPGLPVEFPALRTMAARRVPTSRTPFVGRSRELDELIALVESSLVVTVSGLGGIGKTRLAYEAARRADAEWVVVVELAGAREGTQIVAEVAAAVGARHPDTISDAVGGRDLLLVLDNCEHVVESVAPFVSWLIDACPGTTVLATSREPLGVSGEVVWAVPPLRLNEAVALFRSRALSSSIADDEQLSATACERLGRMPLAIELAAARVRSIPLGDLVARLDDQLELLTGGVREVPRHQTLRATLQWSYDLLTAEEGVVFRRLGVFAGGFSLSAAETVARDGTAHVVRALDGLVTKSLVELSLDGRRYYLLEPVRQYAIEQLAARGDLDAVQQTHARWAESLAREANRRLFSEQRQWTAVLDTERDNMGAAISWALAHGQFEIAARLVSNLASYWFTSARNDAFVWIPLMLDHLDELPRPARGKALLAAGITHGNDRDDPRPLIWLAEAEAIFRELDNRRSLGAALFWLGTAAAARFDLPRAERAFDESLGIHEQLGDLFSAGSSLTQKGAIARLRADLDTDETIQRQVLELCDNIPHVVAQAWSELSQVAAGRGNLAAAEEHIARAADLYRDLGDRWQLGLAQGGRASYLLDTDPAQAAAYNIQALALLREVGADPEMVYPLLMAAVLLLRASKQEQAATIAGSVSGRIPNDDGTEWYKHARRQLTKLASLLSDPTWAVQVERGRRLGLRGAADAAISWLAS